MARSDPLRTSAPGLILEDAYYTIPKSRRGSARPILTGVCLRVRPGERVGIMGPNGAGKSTLLKVLAGLLRLDSGRLINDGYAVTDPRWRYQRSVHLVAGAPLGFYPRLTGAENLRFMAGLWGQDVSRAQAREVLARVGLAPEAAEMMYAKYSLGMRQRLHLAAAELDHAATVWLLDEPTTGLDADGVRLLHDLVADRPDRTYLVVSHDRAFLEKLCPRIVRLDDGRLVG